MRHMRAARDGFGPAFIAHQLGLEDLEAVGGRIAHSLSQSRLALFRIAHGGVHRPIARDQLADQFACDIAGAASDKDGFAHVGFLGLSYFREG